MTAYSARHNRPAVSITDVSRVSRSNAERLIARRTSFVADWRSRYSSSRSRSRLAESGAWIRAPRMAGLTGVGGSCQGGTRRGPFRPQVRHATRVHCAPGAPILLEAPGELRQAHGTQAGTARFERVSRSNDGRAIARLERGRDRLEEHGAIGQIRADELLDEGV